MSCLWLLAQGAFKIDSVLDDALIPIPGHYRLPDDYIVDSIVCPSGNCIVKYTGLGEFSVSCNEDSNVIIPSGRFTLQDNQTNSDFTSKKQNLVESMTANFYCGLNDIIEKDEVTKYVCMYRPGW